MKTARITSTHEAARRLRAGELVAFPTETVFGLGVDATNPAAVERLFAAKGRPSDNPLIAHLGDTDDWAQAASILTPTADALLAAFAPGPLTVVLPKQAAVSSLVTAGLDTVGIRVPQHPAAQEILRQAGMPVAAPSANRSGRPSCTTWESVLEDLDGRIDAVFCEDLVGYGIESTVVDCCGPVATLLRPGAVTIEQIRRVLPDARELSTRTDSGPTDSRDAAIEGVRSPGLAHPHYQPRAEVQLVDRLPRDLDGPAAYCGLGPDRPSGEFALCGVYESVEEYAAAFYEFLREADRRSVETIYVQIAPPEGIGAALRDRQRRAAGG